MFMQYQISKTKSGVKAYPLHRHACYEVMLYLWGRGELVTPQKLYSFSPGTIIIVPPGILHGSRSEDGFCNISVGGNFYGAFSFDAPYSLTDTESSEGTTLVSLIYENRYGNAEYLAALCRAYSAFLAQHIKNENDITTAVRRIVSVISERATDSRFSPEMLLSESGYAPDYIRAHFKKITGKTPISFLTDIRMEHARFSINIYGNTLSLSEIAENCGYTDYVYFSKTFKRTFGMSPETYRKSILTGEIRKV